MADLLPRRGSAGEFGPGPGLPPDPGRQPWYKAAGIFLGAATFTVLAIGVAMLITKGQRVGVVGNTPGPAVAATVGPTAGSVLPPAAPASGPAAPDAVSGAFLGTWSGTIADASGSRSAQETVTVRASRVGSANTTAVAGTQSGCATAWTLLSATPHQLVFRGSPIGDPATDGCPSGVEQQTLTLNPDATVTLSSGGLTGVLDAA